MKTIRTILATFGVTSVLYGVFALIAMRLNPAFTGRSIYQLFRDTGFVALVIGIGCVLSFVIMTIAIVSFRDDGAHKKREFTEDDEFDDFLEEETVPEERADEADESWSPEIKRKQRRALRHADEEPTPDLFADDDSEPEETIPVRGRRKRAVLRSSPPSGNRSPNRRRRFPKRRRRRLRSLRPSAAFTAARRLRQIPHSAFSAASGCKGGTEHVKQIASKACRLGRNRPDPDHLRRRDRRALFNRTQPAAH